MENRFGSCCKDLGEAMTAPPQSFFRIEDNGVFYLTVGFAKTPEGTAWLDQAVLYCPFCGAQLQNREQIRKSVSGS
jgi:hypothetical protein